ncbi:hypothetical protein GGF43_005146, partial [Coemansia sp. RSA 2618]
MSDNKNTANNTQQPQQQSIGSMLPDLDTIGDLGSGTFPFPLTDQASLFNFHTPVGLGIGSFGHDLLGGDIGTSAASAIGASASGGTADDMAVDMAFLNSITQNDPLQYSTASSLPFSQGMSAVSASGALATIGTLGDASAQAFLQPTSAAVDAPTEDAATRMRTARARILNNMLNGMSFEGIQQLDGYHQGSMAVPPGIGLEGISGISGSAGLTPMLSGNAVPNSLDMLTAYSQGITPFPLASPLSPTSPFGTNSQTMAAAGSVSSQQSSTQTRIDQACKMCRRRKVRCDGKRPSCT